MLTVINILNPLTGGSDTKEYPWGSGKSLADYVEYDGECIVACRGEVIPLALSKIFPADKEEYRVLPVPEGGDRETWGVLGDFLGKAAAFVPGWGKPLFAGGALLLMYFLRDKKEDQSMSDSYAWQHRSSPLASHGIAMPIVYGKARVRPILKNRYITTKDDKQVLYALYGLAAHKVDERTLPEYVARSGDREVKWSEQPGISFINTRYILDQSPFVTAYPPIEDGHLGHGWELGHGTAEFADGVIVNGRPIEDWNKDVEWETRPGLLEQFVITGFDVTYSNFVQDVSLSVDYPAVNKEVANFRYRDVDTRVVWDEHPLYLNGIIRTIKGDNTSFAPGVRYVVYYDPALNQDQYYMNFASATLPSTAYPMFYFTGGATGISDKVYPFLRNGPATSDWYAPVLTIASTHNIEITLEFPYGLYGAPLDGNIVSATCRIYAEYRKVGTSTWLSFSSGFSDPDYIGVGAANIVRKTTEPITFSLTAVPKEDALEYNKSYEVRVTAIGPTVVKLVNVATIVYGEENIDEGLSPGFTYPGEPLLGIKALASGQINSDIDVQVDVERSEVWVYNTRYWTNPAGVREVRGWVSGAANDHAWAVYDILAQGHPDHPAYPTAGNEDAEAVYGCGIDKDRIDYESFRAWSDYVNGGDEDEGELGYELNIVFDAFITAWDAILRICQEGRGMVYPQGTTIYAFTDKPADVTQVFTMGNIHLDTFVQMYMDESQKVNVLEVNYYDEERGYQKTTLAARTADWDSGTALSVPTTLTLYGTTTFDQAFSIARFALMGNELLNNVITFGVDVDALAAQVGDVVEVQHDILTTGQGGRIIGVVQNYLLNGSFESALLPNWTKWRSPSVYGQSTDVTAKYGTYSFHTRCTVDNGGGQQTFMVKPNTEYTLSAWVYMLNVYVPGTTIRAMTRATGSSYSKAKADETLLNQWQRVSVTFTTAVGQTEATVWLGGIGEAYFDGVMFNEGATAQDFRLGAALTFDRTLSDVAGQVYQLVIYHTDGSIETKNGITHGNVKGAVITFGEGWTWDRVSEVYEVYSFGVSGAHTFQYRITEISRTTELMRTLTLVQYDEDVYDSYKPSNTPPVFDPSEFSLNKISMGEVAVGDVANLLNIASNLQLREVVSRNRATGEYESAIVATWDVVSGDPHGTWEVWFRDVDASDVDWEGTWEGVGEYEVGAKVELDGKTYISLEDDNTSQPISI